MRAKISLRELLHEIFIKLSNYEGQILKGDWVRAPKGFVLSKKDGPLKHSLLLKVYKISRKGINKYKLFLEDPVTKRRYRVFNYMMDGEYRGEKIPQWSKRLS